MTYLVNEVADLVGISVRTLHHYDKIGLLKPDGISESGYRLYSDNNLETLQQILFHKELGFSLKEIKEILIQPNFNRIQALQAQKQALLLKQERINKMIETVDETIYSLKGGTKMDKKKMFSGFDTKDIEAHQNKYAEEVRQKYGKTKAYQESKEKVATYSKEDMANIMEESNQLFKEIADLMGLGPEDNQVQEKIGAYRAHITKYFYNCTLEIFRGLGDLYVNDPRFTKNIDKFKEGLSSFLQDAIYYYCQNQEDM